jgi:Transglycosylase SLT domain
MQATLCQMIFRSVTCAMGLLGLAAAALGEVRVETGADGHRVMVNSGERAAVAELRPGREPLSPLDVEPAVTRYATLHGLDPRLVHAVIRTESDYDRWAVSVKGAAGLMQLMPETVRDFSVRDPYDAEENIAAGTAYLKQLIDRFDGSLELALAAYNAGPETVVRYGGIPPFSETQSYVTRVLAAYRPGVPADLEASPRPASEVPRGRPTHLYRDRAGRLVMTTSPPPGPR